MPSSTARATARSRSAGAPRTMMPPTSPQPKASAETLSPVLPSIRYSIEVSIWGQVLHSCCAGPSPHSIAGSRRRKPELLRLRRGPLELGLEAGQRALELSGAHRAAVADEGVLDDAHGAGMLALVPVGPGHLVPGLRELVWAHLRAALVDQPSAHRDRLVEATGRRQELAQVLDETLRGIAHHAVGAVVGAPAMVEVALVAESRELETVGVVADHPVQEADGRRHHLRIIRVVEDALIGRLEEMTLAAAVVTARVTLPGGEEFAQVIQAVGCLDAIPPVGARRGRDEGGDELSLPRLALCLEPGPFRLDDALLSLPEVVIAGPRHRRDDEHGNHPAPEPAYAAALGIDDAEKPTRTQQQHHEAGARGQIRPARQARIPHPEAIVPGVGPAVMRVQVADETVVLPGLDAEHVVLAVRGRAHGESGRGLRRLPAQDVSARPRLAAGAGDEGVAILGAGGDRLPGEINRGGGTPGVSRRVELRLFRTAGEHALDRAGIVSRTREMDEPRQVHDEALRTRGRDLEGELRLVVTGEAAGVGRILVDADMHLILSRPQRLEHVCAGRAGFPDPATDPAVECVAIAGEVRRSLGVEDLVVEAQLELDVRLSARGAREKRRRGGHGQPPRTQGHPVGYEPRPSPRRNARTVSAFA